MGFALVTGAAVEPIDRNALGRRLEQQAIMIGLTLDRLGCHRHLGAVTRHGDQLVERQVLASQGDRLVRHRRIDRHIGGGDLGLRAEAPQTGNDRRRRQMRHGNESAKRETSATLFTEALDALTRLKFLFRKIAFLAGTFHSGGKESTAFRPYFTYSYFARSSPAGIASPCPMKLAAWFAFRKS